MKLKKSILSILLFVYGVHGLSQSKLEYFEFFANNFFTSEQVDSTVMEDGKTWITYYSDSIKNLSTVVSQIQYDENGNLMFYLRTGQHNETTSYLQEVHWSEKGKLVSFRYNDKGKHIYIDIQPDQICIENFNTNKWDEQMFCWNGNGEKIAEYNQRGDSIYSNYYYSNNNIREKIIQVRAFGYNFVTGIYEYYHPNGQLFIKGVYNFSDQVYAKKKGNNPENYRHSKWTYFNTHGKVIKTETYHYGKLLSSESNKRYIKFVKSKVYREYEMLVRFEENEGRFWP